MNCSIAKTCSSPSAESTTTDATTKINLWTRNGWFTNTPATQGPLLGLLSTVLIGVAHPVAALTFGQQEMDQSRVVAIAVPLGSNQYQLMLLEQLTQNRPCWQESTTQPVTVEPFEANFERSELCRRLTDSRDFSIRDADVDRATPYSLRLVRQNNQLVLLGSPRTNNPRERANPSDILLGRTEAMSAGLAKIQLEPGWRFTRKTLNGNVMEHIYFSQNQPAAKPVASVTAAPSRRTDTRSLDTRSLQPQSLASTAVSIPVPPVTNFPETSRGRNHPPQRQPLSPGAILLPPPPTAALPSSTISPPATLTQAATAPQPTTPNPTRRNQITQRRSDSEAAIPILVPPPTTRATSRTTIPVRANWRTPTAPPAQAPAAIVIPVPPPETRAIPSPRYRQPIAGTVALPQASSASRSQQYSMDGYPLISAAETTTVVLPVSSPLGSESPPVVTTGNISLLPVPDSRIPFGQAGDDASLIARLENLPPPPDPSAGLTLEPRFRVVVETANPQQQQQVRTLVPDAFRSYYQGRTVMQVGSFKERFQAEEMIQIMTSNGFQAIIEPIQ